jgi:hypothetical protein
MRFGNVDVTEGQMCIIAIMMLTALWGPSFWDIKVRSSLINTASRAYEQLNLIFQLLGLLEMRFVPTIVGVLAGGASLIMALEKIGTGGAGKNGSTVAVRSLASFGIPIEPISIHLTISGHERDNSNHTSATRGLLSCDDCSQVIRLRLLGATHSVYDYVWAHRYKDYQ